MPARPAPSLAARNQSRSNNDRWPEACRHIFFGGYRADVACSVLSGNSEGVGKNFSAVQSFCCLGCAAPLPSHNAGARRQLEVRWVRCQPSCRASLSDLSAIPRTLTVRGIWDRIGADFPASLETLAPGASRHHEPIADHPFPPGTLPPGHRTASWASIASGDGGELALLLGAFCAARERVGTGYAGHP